MKILYKTMHGLFAVMLVGVAVLFLSPTIPFPGHVEVKIVKSGSMEPAIMTGGVVLVRARDTYAVGDVITFKSRNGNIPTTHRIAEFKEEDGVSTIITKGDANEEADTEHITKDAIIGKVLFTLPYAGFILDFARQPVGFILLIGLPAFLIVIDEIDKIWKETRRIRKPKIVRREIAPLIVAPFIPERRRVRMMDINRPVSVRVAEARQVRTAPQVAPSASPLRSNWVMAPCAVLAVTALMANLWSIGGTVSYLSDTENSLSNKLEAGVLGFSVLPDGTSFTFFDGILDDPDGALITLVAPEGGSAPMRYSLVTNFVSGNQALCDAIIVSTSDPFIYDGSLSALSASDVSFGGSWTLAITLADGALYAPDDTCVVDLVYNSWNALLTDSSGGYADEESTELTFVASSLIGSGFRSFSVSAGVDPEALLTDMTATDTPPEDVPGEIPPGEGTVDPIESPESEAQTGGDESPDSGVADDAGEVEEPSDEDESDQTSVSGEQETPETETEGDNTGV